MEMLNSVSMFLAGNLWTNLIGIFAKWVVNYGWAIVLFTVALKLVLSPMDIFQRISSAKQQKVMTAVQPELAALQQKYGNNKDRLNHETAKLYKKHNVSLGGMCLTMLITMTVTMVVFFTLFSSLRSYGNEKLYSTYKELDDTYIAAEVYIAENQTEFETEQEKRDYIVEVIENKYEEQSKQNSWLWVKNVWKGDTNTSQFVEFADYAANQGLNAEDKGAEKALAEARYNDITGIVEIKNPGQNGYYVLIILSGVISFLTQFLSAKLMTPKGQKMNTMNKVMFVVIPLTMVSLAASSNVVFTLYVIVNSLMTAILSTIMSIITKSKNKNQPEEVVLKKKNIEVVEYSRNYRK